MNAPPFLCFPNILNYISKTVSRSEEKGGNHFRISDLWNGVWRKINTDIQTKKIIFCLVISRSFGFSCFCRQSKMIASPYKQVIPQDGNFCRSHLEISHMEKKPTYWENESVVWLRKMGPFFKSLKCYSILYKNIILFHIKIAIHMCPNFDIFMFYTW